MLFRASLLALSMAAITVHEFPTRMVSFWANLSGLPASPTGMAGLFIAFLALVTLLRGEPDVRR